MTKRINTDIHIHVILAMLKYCHRLEGQQEGLLFDAYICNKELHFSKINTWYSSILYIMDELKISGSFHKNSYDKKLS